jgi:fatty acid/phospholipid biosynthesis enzyme
MCPICIANAAAMVAGAGSTGGVLAVCIGKLKRFFTVNRPGLLQKTKER